MAPANTGKDKRSKMAVIFTAHEKRVRRSDFIPGGFIFIIVEIKFIAPKIDDTPAMWSLKIARSTDAPSWEILEAKGG